MQTRYGNSVIERQEKGVSISRYPRWPSLHESHRHLASRSSFTPIGTSTESKEGYCMRRKARTARTLLISLHERRSNREDGGRCRRTEQTRRKESAGKVLFGDLQGSPRRAEVGGASGTVKSKRGSTKDRDRTDLNAVGEVTIGASAG